MADRSQPGQRGVYHATAYRPDNVRDYHDEYVQTLSYFATDVPVHAQVCFEPTHPHLNVNGHGIALTST